jgi:hypothetical protein
MGFVQSAEETGALIGKRLRGKGKSKDLRLKRAAVMF